MNGPRQTDWIADALADVPALATVDEAAAVLRVSRRTISRMTSSGNLSAVHVGTGVRIPRRAIADYLSARGGR